MSAIAALLADGWLHLQHGPIDCLCQAWGSPAEIRAAYNQAAAHFQTVLTDLCAELPLLRQPLPAPLPQGAIAQAMHAACTPFATEFITPMAAVAGAVADAVLAAMCDDRTLAKAFVNNGGDIAFHLAPGTSLRCGLVTDLAAIPSLDGTFLLTAAHPARGLATSGRACKGQGGRSFSFGIADSVSILARTAAQADAAATIIGNAVNIPGHPAIDRRPASDIDPDSDLGDRLVTFDVGILSDETVSAALDAGATMADNLLQAGLIEGAVLALRGRVRIRQSALALQEVA
jgi:ApbE superfamily uncharacterized protein (UPF0280 family)